MNLCNCDPRGESALRAAAGIADRRLDGGFRVAAKALRSYHDRVPWLYGEQAEAARGRGQEAPVADDRRRAVGNRLREYEDESVRKTLDPSFCPELILNAREVQDQILIQRYKGAPIKIADVGCGDGYHGALFAPACILYHGFEISTEMAEQARRKWRELGLTNAEVFVGDAGAADPEPNFYDVVWILYFTPGNFRDEFDDIRRYDDSYLDGNPRFISIVSTFYRGLEPGGTMFLTVYKDVPEAEQSQRDFYHNTGQHVITPPGSRFVATAENFWSVRFTRESMLANLADCGIGPTQVTFNSLNAIAWLVEVGK